MSFTNLPVGRGEGPVHVNYFRTYLRPTGGQGLPSANDLMARLPDFMNPHTATAWVDQAHRYAGRPTLAFRGVARVRPFAVLPTPGLPSPITVVPLPDRLARAGVPENVRQMMIPQVHTDHVGVFATGTHSFTVQTLKRNYETADDVRIRHWLLQNLHEAPPTWRDRAMDALRYLSDPGGWTAQQALDAAMRSLADYAVSINQHHFLAGRRSFRMGTVGGSRMTNRPTGVRDGDWVFETAAVERYSLRTFESLTNFGMGGASRVVRPVWVEMGAALARVYGTMLAPVSPMQIAFGTLDAARQSAALRDINSRHLSLIPNT